MMYRVFDNGLREVSVDLPVGTMAPAVARQVVSNLDSFMPPDRFENLRLLVSEVVTNVCRHTILPAGDEQFMGMRVLVGEGRLECTVCDTGTGFEPPVKPHPRSDMSGGWGLFILDKLSDHWGVRREGAFFCVWFEMSW